MDIEEIKVKKAQAKTDIKSISERLNQMEQEKQNMLQTILRLDGKLSVYNELIESVCNELIEAEEEK